MKEMIIFEHAKNSAKIDTADVMCIYFCKTFLSWVTSVLMIPVSITCISRPLSETHKLIYGKAFCFIKLTKPDSQVPPNERHFPFHFTCM